MSAKFWRRRLAHFIEYLFAPGLCLACGGEISGAEALCEYCAERLETVPRPCRHCGQPNPVDGRVCPACLLNPPRWQRLHAPLRYDGLTRDYLHQFKYAEALHLVKPLCRRSLANFARADPWPQVLLPVPLHRERLLERGFNQADEIARQWSRAISVPIDRDVLERLCPTPSQSDLTAAQRQQNVRGVFACKNPHGYRHVAIVDDVVTTGSTVAEITRVLHRAGIEYVEVWALARAYRD